jgi:ABC-type proline/glycine betaine transport system permease subunit
MNLINFLQTNFAELLSYTLQHLFLAVISTLIGSAIGIPTGILLTRRPQLSKPILGIANVVQTIPSLALLGFLVPLPFIGGIGPRSAIVALSLYSLLPLIRSTYAGINGIDRAVIESGRGMGMNDKQLLTQVELPLAAGVIFAGIRVAMVLSIGIATIAALTGAGGLGMYIFRGISMLDHTLILAGAIPSAILALAADGVLGLIQKKLTHISK